MRGNGRAHPSRGDESGAAAAAAEAAAAQAASKAAASEAAHAKLQEDFENRETSKMVSEELAGTLVRTTDETKKAKAKDFFNGVFLDVCKNTADLSNLNTRVEEIATRVTTNELWCS